MGRRTPGARGLQATAPTRRYSDSQWLEPAAIIAGDFHPALKYAVHSLLAMRALRELQAHVASVDADDGETAKLARAFCELSAAAQPTPGVSEYRVIAPALAYECDVTVTL